MNFRWRFVLPLAVTQLVSWGSLYHAFAVVAGPMALETGWSSTAVNGALSASLAATGIASPFAGRIIDAKGGHILMTGGSIAAMGLLCAWSQVSELWHLYVVWIAMGAVFSAVLYETVFAVIARELGKDYRRAIITITLLGGLASTAFIPLTYFLIEELTWRKALLVLAAVQVPFGIAIHWLVPKEPHGSSAASKRTVSPGRVMRAMAQPVFCCLALSYAAHAFMFTGLTFHINPVLSERGFALPVIVAAYAVVGPFQVIGRILVFALERHINARIAGTVGTSLPVIGMIVLLLSLPGSSLLYVFAAFYGGGMGIKTIMQATAGPEFLGRKLWCLAGGVRRLQFHCSGRDAICLGCPPGAVWDIRLGVMDTVRISMCFRPFVSCCNCYQASSSTDLEKQHGRLDSLSSETSLQLPPPFLGLRSFSVLRMSAE